MGFSKRINVDRMMGGGGGSNPIFRVRNETFFDRRPVIAALDEKSLKVMARLGGYVRKVMQNSMKTPRARARELRNRWTTDDRGVEIYIDNRGRCHEFTETGPLLPKQEAAVVKRRLAEELGARRPSPAGKPPHSHKDEHGNPGALKRLTEFGYDRHDKTLVIGPQLITSPTVVLGGGTVPSLLDRGGRAISTSFGGGAVVAKYPARPFVAPARDKGFKRLEQLLKTIPLVEVKGR